MNDQLDEWLRAVCASLDLEKTESNVTEILGVAKEVAHNVVRPAAPVTTYLMGLAVGRGKSLEHVTEEVNRLASTWTVNDE